MTEPSKKCPSCRISKSQEAFAKNKATRDGLYPYCRECANAKSRERYERMTDTTASCLTHVPPELLPKLKRGESIGCLRCRHARLEPDTDFNSAMPMIHCRKMDCRRMVCFMECPIADARPAQPRHLHKYWAKYGPLGDKITRSTPLLLKYLSQRWPVESDRKLTSYTGHSMAKLAAIVRYNGVGGVRVGKHRLRFGGKRGSCPRFAAAQRKWLWAEYNSDRWPLPAVKRCFPDELQRRLDAQSAVVEHVATLGPRWSWEQILRHIQKQKQTRNNNVRKARRGEGRKVNQWLSVPVVV